MLQTPELELSSPSTKVTLPSYKPMLFTLANSLLPNRIMMWETGNFWPWRLPLKSGVIGSRGQDIRFLGLTDHRNLGSAKRLGPRQARWALFFFTQFDFTISYPPGSKNMMAKSLSHQHDRSPQNLSPETIIPTSLILAPIQWDVMTEITQAHSQHPPPSSVPS